MHYFSSDLSEKMKERLYQAHPDIFLFINNRNIEVLFDTLINIMADELTKIKNEYIRKDDLRS